MTGPVHWASEPMTINGRAWRVIVTDSVFGGRRFAYQFTPPGALVWQDQRTWPRFDQGETDMGLPRSLALLFAVNKVAIDAALAGADSVTDLRSIREELADKAQRRAGRADADLRDDGNFDLIETALRA